MFTLYSILSFVGFILLLPYFLVQAVRHGKYLASLMERTGRLPRSLRQDERGAIWIHAVSVGESNAIVPLVSQLRARAGERKIFISTTTLTGQRNARGKITEADGFFYYPFDWRRNVRRSLAHIQPAMVCLAETELWPNFIHEAHRQGVRLAVVNGRISERSFRWYARARGFLRQFLSEIDLYLMQTDEDADRIRRLGAPADRVVVSGNLKYDIEPDRRLVEGLELIRKYFLAGAPAPVWIAGSTAEGEEELVLRAFERLRTDCPTARLILAPRHPERFSSVAALLTGRHWDFVRRSQLGPVDGSSSKVLLLDTMGELSALYAFAQVAFVGGSLVKKGGHNILEPAAAGVPVVMGPFMSNFAKMVRDFLEHNAAIQVRGAEELGSVVKRLLKNPRQSREMGERGRMLLNQSAGATARTVEKILELL